MCVFLLRLSSGPNLGMAGLEEFLNPTKEDRFGFSQRKKQQSIAQERSGHEQHRLVQGKVS